jgi:hypothetical protein
MYLGVPYAFLIKHLLLIKKTLLFCFHVSVTFPFITLFVVFVVCFKQYLFPNGSFEVK